MIRHNSRGAAFYRTLGRSFAYENHNTVSLACSDAGFDGAYRMLHAYEIRPRKDHRGVDLISDALPFGRLWYTKPGRRLSNTRSFAVDHITPSFAFTMSLAT
jgi:hypothetical protein